MMIILGCKELASLDARDCTGFKADDAGILQLASHIPAFKCEGSRDFKNYRQGWSMVFHNKNLKRAILILNGIAFFISLDSLMG